MENTLKTKILTAVGLLNNPDEAKRRSAEDYLNNENTTNLEFFANLMQLIAGTEVNEIQKTQLILVLKMFVTKKWNNLPENIKVLIKSNIIDVLMRSTSLKLGKLVADVLYPLVLKNYPMNWATLDEELLTKIKANSQDASKMYFLLLAYLKVSKSMEIDNENSDKVEQSMSMFFPLLEELLTNLMQSELNELNLAFISLIIKIFFRCNRFKVRNYMKNNEKCSIWMNYLLAIFNYKDGRLKNARKWVAKSLVHFFRNYFFFKKSEVEKNKDIAFLNYWSENWGFKFTETFCDYLYTYEAEQDEGEVVFNISRSFFYIPKNEQVMSRYKEVFSKLFNDNLFKLSLLTKDDIETYQMDPAEFFKKNDDLAFERSLREASNNIVKSLAQNGFYNELIQMISSKMNNNPSVLEKENCYYFIQSLKGQIIKDKDTGIASIEQMFINYILPDGTQEVGILRTRVMILIETFCSYFQNQQLIEKSVALISQGLEDPDMPVRSFSAIALDRLLTKPEVVDMIRPHIQKILLIFIKIINECDHERLVNSLTGIFESYNKEIGPYVLDLVVTLKNLIFKLYNRSQVESSENVEESEFSILSAFTAIKELVKADFDQQIIPELFKNIEELIFQALGDHDLEVIEEILDLINLLIFRSPKNNIHPGLWNFFEFLCYSTALKLPLPENNTCQNKFLTYLAQNRKNFQEFSSHIIRCFRNYVYIGKDDLLTKRDEQGNAYIDLLLCSIEECKKYESDIVEDSILIETSMLEAILVFEYKDNLEIIKSKNLLTNCLNQTYNLVNEQRNSELYHSAKIHNLGLLCASFFNETMQVYNTNENFLNEWIRKHMNSLTYRVRKASFLGLLNVLRNYKSIPQLNSNLSYFVTILLKELVVLKLHKNHEEDVDYDLDDFSDDEEEIKVTDMTIQDFLQESTIAQIEKRISSMDNNFMMETEILLNYDWDFILESLQSLQTETVAKETFMLIEQEHTGMTAHCLSQLKEEISGDIQKILSN